MTLEIKNQGLLLNLKNLFLETVILELGRIDYFMKQLEIDFLIMVEKDLGKILLSPLFSSFAS